jgi:peptidoglycan/xylan/chitin deacetylase (PgdA/CDA1 family)
VTVIAGTGAPPVPGRNAVEARAAGGTWRGEWSSDRNWTPEDHARVRGLWPKVEETGRRGHEGGERTSARAGPVGSLSLTAYGKRMIGLPLYLSRTGRTTVLWDLEPDSWYRTADEMVAHVLENVGPGSIILLHVELAARVEERAALPRIIEGVQALGYEFVTVSELMTRQGASWNPRSAE